MDEKVIENDHHARSAFVRRLVQHSFPISANASDNIPPRRIVQFWHDLDKIPKDVEQCINSWRQLNRSGFETVIFDAPQAKDFIAQRLGYRYANVYDRCYHPAMQSDFFRLCYVFVEGGLYVDADDVYQGKEIDHLFSDSRMKISPLCYDCATNSMVPHSVFMKPGINSPGWIFYFNNNPLVAGPRNYLIHRALSSATASLEAYTTDMLPEIQSTTGPGNLTKSIFAALAEHWSFERDLVVLRNWESIATSKWPLSYRYDARNWRLSNQRGFIE
jgi:hypothetical protein